MATGSTQTHTKFGEDRLCGYRVMRADRQTDILITILHIPPQGKVVIVTMFTALSAQQSHCESSHSSSDKCRLSLLANYMSVLWPQSISEANVTKTVVNTQLSAARFISGSYHTTSGHVPLDHCYLCRTAVSLPLFQCHLAAGMGCGCSKAAWHELHWFLQCTSMGVHSSSRSYQSIPLQQ